MKIAQVCPYDIDRPGGVQRHILDLAGALRDLGHQVGVIAPGPAPAPGRRADPATCYVGGRRSVGFSGTRFEVSHAGRAELARLVDHLATARYDLLHFHTLWVPLLPYQVLRRNRAAVVATFHDTPPTDLHGRLLRQLFRGLAYLLRGRIDQSIAVSESPAGHLGALPRDRLSVLPPAVDLRPYAATPAAARDRPGTPPTLLYLGRLEPRKSPLDLLRACALLQREGLAVRLRIAGDGVLREQVAQVATASGLADCRLLGAVEQRDLPGLYAAADLFCAPSRYGESFGIVLTEAMAAGVAVIAAANSGYSTVLRGGGERFLYPPGDIAALAERIRTLVVDPARRAAHAAWGRERARDCDVRSLAPRFVEIYRRALEQPVKRYRQLPGRPAA